MILNNRTKIFLTIVCFVLSVVGFMMRLPSSFSHIDKELHTLFYFSAAGFFNLLYSNKNMIKHFVIFLSLFIFGVLIEFAQEYSNTLFHKRIHGRFAIKDVHANLRGLILFSIVWVLYTSIIFLFNKQMKHKSN
jgi:hypothetical protein